MKTATLIKIASTSLILAVSLFISSCQTVSDSYSGANSSPYIATAPAAKKAASSRYAESRSVERRGLATGWGQRVSSNVDFTSFVRSSSMPAGTSTIYYNDKAGIDAMTDSWKYTGKGMQSAANGLVEWGVKSSWGTLKNYNSSGRRYVVGSKDSNYALVVKNRSYSRLEVVLSVDGLDVMDGKSASFSKRGYIINPGKTLTVKGFRTSESAVAAFKFSTVSGSYANQRHGNTRNVGVIGLAVFTQKGSNSRKWSVPADYRRQDASPFAEIAR